jgi:hypothetical protein
MLRDTNQRIWNVAVSVLREFLRSAQAAAGGAKRTRNSADLAAGGESVVREFLRSRSARRVRDHTREELAPAGETIGHGWTRVNTDADLHIDVHPRSSVADPEFLKNRIGMRYSPRLHQAPRARAREVARLKRSTLRSIATDLHFWVPVIVLILGTALLMALR